MEARSLPAGAAARPERRSDRRPPGGNGHHHGLDPESSVLSDSYDEIEARYTALDYDWVEEGKAERLARIDHDWALIEAMLPPPFEDVPTVAARA